MAYAWPVRGAWMACTWYAWLVRVPCVVRAWPARGACMACSWPVHGMVGAYLRAADQVQQGPCAAWAGHPAEVCVRADATHLPVQVTCIYGQGKLQWTRVAAISPLTGMLEEKQVQACLVEVSR